MNQLFRYVSMFILTLWIVPEGKAIFVDIAKDIYLSSESSAYTEPRSSIEAPVIPPYYFISKEEAATQTITDSMRYQFVFLQTSRLVPANYCFKKDLRFTTVLIDHEAPVPLFILGHALRH